MPLPINGLWLLHLYLSPFPQHIYSACTVYETACDPVRLKSSSFDKTVEITRYERFPIHI